jgi:hypothetical protein
MNISFIKILFWRRALTVGAAIFAVPVCIVLWTGFAIRAFCVAFLSTLTDVGCSFILMARQLASAIKIAWEGREASK